MGRITVEEISRKEFSFAPKGYNQKEVDDFLDDICDEIERLEGEIVDLKQKTSAIRPAASDPAPVSEKNEEAFRERLNGLSDEQKALETEVAALKKTAADYRAQFEALLQAQQEALEKAADLF